MRLEDYGLFNDNGKLGICSTGGRRKKANSDTVLNHLRDLKDITRVEAADLMDKLVRIAEEEIPETPVEIRRRKVVALDPFSNFSVYINKKSGSHLVYYEDKNSKIPICLLNTFDKSFVQTVLATHDPNLYNQLISQLPSLINPKSPDMVSAKDIIEVCMNILHPEVSMTRLEIEQEPHPAVVKGCKVPSLKVIPYHEEPSSLDDLNPYLKEFLTRVSNHENMCAHLWLNFIGKKTAELIYLKGRGGDGKSIFVKMLGDISGLVCNYDWNERFNYFNMFGKSLIIMNENKMPNILQHSVLKAITGGDLVQIEAKGKNAFSAEVRGQLIIVANDDLRTLGTPDEERRLRYYQVSTPNVSKEALLGPDDYLAEISSTQNKFLNYLRVCYEKYKTKMGLVEPPENHTETIKALRDPEIQQVFVKIMDSLVGDNKPYIIDPTLTLNSAELLDTIKAADKSKYAISNFESLLSVDYGIVKNMNEYIGIGRRQIK